MNIESNQVLEYLDTLPKVEQKALSVLREQILAVNPNFEERLRRGVPFFYYRSKSAVGFRASKKHLSFFIMEGNVLNVFKNEIAEFDNSTTVIRFTADKPLPERLIKKLVLARLTEIDNSLTKKSRE